MPAFSGVGGTKLHYTDEGAGVPVLCLSGLTRNGTDFDYLAPHLDGVRLIRMDYRGRGQSDWAPPETYTIPTEGMDAVMLLDHLGVDRVGILGTSRGGLIAMGLAATVKARLAGVCLVDIGPELAPEGLTAIMGYLGRNPVQKTHAEAAGMRATLMAGFDGVPKSRWAEEVAKHYVETPEGLRINYDPKLRDAVEATGAEPAPDLWPLFDAMEGLPLGLIRGANSDLLSPETFAEMRRRRPDAVAAEVPGRGHVPFLDEPASLDVVRGWIRRMGDAL